MPVTVQVAAPPAVVEPLVNTPVPPVAPRVSAAAPMLPAFAAFAPACLQPPWSNAAEAGRAESLPPVAAVHPGAAPVPVAGLQGEDERPWPVAPSPVALAAPSARTNVVKLAPALAPALPAVAPVLATQGGGPTQGDVFLDGSRVGRWMSDQLAREADHPASGVTGFDPRLGAVWPGAMHGT
jgi:hypothetical protein